MSFQRAVFMFITVAGTWWGDSIFLRLQDLMIMTTDDLYLITQLPVGFGEHSSICLAGVFERRFVVSIATFKLWLRETISVHVFFRMIWGTDSWFINYTLFSHAMSFQRAVFRFITVAGTWWGHSLFRRLQDLMIMTTDDWSHVWHTTIWHLHSFLLKILCYGCPTWKCRSRSSRKRLPILMVTCLSNGRLNQMMYLFRWRFCFALWDDCNFEGAVQVSVLLKPLFFKACSYAGFALSNSSHDIDDNLSLIFWGRCFRIDGGWFDLEYM